ncbi:MAG: class I SAM-dependent methyltransferase [Clostridia bacterium]|nr:class I SAM-dependent methyltransferase [Clostridia bacterium]
MDNGQFTALAEVYDRLNGADYKAYARYVQRVLEKYGSGSESLMLDLGCGTGSLTLALAELGYDMIGADISPEMLSIASERAYGAEKSILFLMQDMRDFELYGTVSGAVSALDGINYLTERKDVIKCFKLVRNYLDPGALFLFDVNSEYRFREVLSKRDYFLEDEGVCLGWRSDFDEKTGLCDFYLTVFEQGEDGRYVRRDETQTEKLWTDCEIEDMLTESGLEKVAVFSGFDMKKAEEKDEKRFYVVRCPFNK